MGFSERGNQLASRSRGLRHGSSCTMVGVMIILTGITRDGIAWSWSSTNSALRFLRRKGSGEGAERRFRSPLISEFQIPTPQKLSTSSPAFSNDPDTPSRVYCFNYPPCFAIASSFPHSWRELYWLCFNVPAILQAVVPVTTSPVVSLPGATA